jgi:hypothetical protein
VSLQLQGGVLPLCRWLCYYHIDAFREFEGVAERQLYLV